MSVQPSPSTKRAYSEFDHFISPYYQDIKKYCFGLTSSVWEAEDLFQDTLMKIYLAIKKRPDRELSKRFVYLIAKNTWIEQKRKRRIDTEFLDDQEKYAENFGGHTYELQLRESLEILSEYLNTKQFVIVLLVDVFQFTAKETAEMINETESNVYTTLHRSRKKLERYERLSKHSKTESKPENTIIEESTKHMMCPTLFETFMNAFKARNPQLIYETYLSLTGQGIQVKKNYTSGFFHDSLCFKFIDPDGNVLTICS
jgi:RNA polymerase sigma factor (sigma-70 family)